MSLNYGLAQAPQSIETIARIIRNDADGSVIEVSSAGMAARVLVRDLVAEINRLEELKARMNEASAPLEDGVNE